MRLIFCSFFIVISTIACNTVSNKKKTNTTPSTTTEMAETKPISINAELKEGQLFINSQGQTQLITDEGEITGYYLSDDKHNLITEVQLFSTLSVIRHYQFNPNTNQFDKDEKNLNTDAWAIYDKKQPTTSSENLSSSFVNFIKWLSKDSIEVELRGSTANGETINEMVRLNF